MDIACFISPHGFGHATRTIAVIEALSARLPDLHVHLLTSIPRHLFSGITVPHTYHETIVDIGFIQSDAFVINISRTLAALRKFLPLRRDAVEASAAICRSCRLLLCDISPLGIETGKLLGTPTVLIENFTWDWIYSSLDCSQVFSPFISELSRMYQNADFHIQAEPVCRPAVSDLTCNPIYRRPKTPSSETRKTLGCQERKIVLITTGGIQVDLPFISQLPHYEDYFFILTGQGSMKKQLDNVLLLPYDSGYYHPDLIKAANVIICKSGYSTISECLSSNASVYCVDRRNFAESTVLERFVREQLRGRIIPSSQFSNGSWLEHLSSTTPVERPQLENGAEQAASYISSLLQ